MWFVVNGLLRERRSKHTSAEAIHMLGRTRKTLPHVRSSWISRGSPCHYCQLPVKPAARASKTVLLFQGSPADLLVKDNGDGHTRLWPRGRPAPAIPRHELAGGESQARAGASKAKQTRGRQQGRKNQEEDRAEELSNMVRLLSKALLRHEDEHSRLRVKSGFLDYCDTGEHGVTSTLLQMAKSWKAKKEEGSTSEQGFHTMTGTLSPGTALPVCDFWMAC